MTGKTAPNIIDIKSENRILFIKARFETHSGVQNLYGQLFIIITNMEALESYHAIISPHSETYDVELHTSWNKYQEFIIERKWKGLFSINLTNALNLHLDQFRTDRTMYKLLYQYTINSNYSKLDMLLYDLVNHVLHEKTLRIESVIQEISTEEYNKVVEARNKPVERPLQTNLEDSKKEDDSVILKVKPVLAPVKGKPIYTLKVGDTIMVKIVPDTPKQKEYIKIFKLEENGVIRSVPANVIDIKYGTDKNDPFEIIVKIEEKIFGKIIENERQIKLRIYDPKIDGNLSIFGLENEAKNYLQLKSGDRSLKIFILILSIFLTILFVFVAYVFIH
ncbi:MAG: hypothetical protein FWG92_04520 [Leptospirales bacterium]|nr:hypothetical protein [Leptospirales bacterium]